MSRANRASQNAVLAVRLGPRPLRPSLFMLLTKFAMAHETRHHADPHAYFFAGSMSANRCAASSGDRVDAGAMRAIIRRQSSELMSLRNRIKWLHTLRTHVAEAVPEPERRPFHMKVARQTALPLVFPPLDRMGKPDAHRGRVHRYF